MSPSSWLQRQPRLLLVFLPSIVILGFALVLTIVMFVRHRDRLRTEALDRIDAVATVQEARIEASLRENFDVDLAGLLSRSGIADSIREIGADTHDPHALQLLTTELTRALNPVFADLLVTHTDGTVIASTDQRRVGTLLTATEFVSAAAQAPTSGGVSLNRRGELIQTVGGPLVSTAGDTHVLVLESDEQELIRLAADYTGLGTTGETVIAALDEQNAAVFVVPLRFDADAAFNRSVPATELGVPITKAFRNEESVFTNTVDYRGEHVLAATRYLPSADLGLVVKIDRSEAFSSINRLARDLVTIFIGIALFTLALGAILVRLLNRQDRMRRISNVFEEAVDPMIVEDRQGTIIDVNPQAVDSYGWTRNELIGNSVRMLTTPGSADVSEDLHARSWAGQQTDAVEVDRLCKSGDVIPVLLSLSGLTDATGQRVATVTVEKDMRDVHRIHRELVDAKEEAEEANRAKSDFLSRMSHELRTPLTSVIGFAQLLELTLHEPDDLESLDYIRAGGEHLLSMIEDLLDLSRIDAGTLAPSFAPVDVRAVTADSIGLLRPQAEARNVDVIEKLGPELVVSADEDQLRQVVLNLLSNAIKFNNDDGSITIVTSAIGDKVRWAITDTGDGIAAEFLGDLFKPFERLGAQDRGIPGTGLGLALSKNLVERMGGSIGANTVEGEGSTFWFELSAATRPESADLSSESPEVPARFAHVGGS